ncbi:macrophage mannose receptor 1-like [Montipora capricornis]|uniref:macrophage mannose receptor 1-like n=1 Tax=Montipora capricornis TaxID=246305 RepID=UPI0035F16B50
MDVHRRRLQRNAAFGWEIGLDDNCYQINSNQWKIWADARATCLSRGGDLVSIVSVREKNWLNDRLKALSSWAYTFWIGLNDRDISKHFYWSDRSPYRLTAWDRGYPRDYKLQNYRACVEIDASRGAWRDVSCGEYRPFICKKKMVSTDGNKFPVTGNWISATSYYWPLNALVDNGTKVAGTTPGYVYGNIMNKTDGYQVGRDALWFASYNACVETGPFSDGCITDPSQCINGITVSFVGQFEDGAQMWTRNTFIVNTIGNETLLQGKPGFAVYVANSQLYVTVVTPTKYWTLNESLTTGNTVWQHVMFCWQLEKGLALYINGTERSSLHQGKSSVYSGNTSLSLIVGSKSIQRTAGGFLVRSLALWKRFFSPREVNKIYLAELGSCQTGWNVFGQFCYQFNQDKKSWHAARLACVSQQAELASIHSPVEQAYITLEVAAYGLDASSAWIGLNDKGVESEFKWSDSSNVEYTNWGAKQPDDWFSREDCVHVRQDYRWNDLTCDSSLGYICKKPKEYIAPNKVPGNKAPQELNICEYTHNVLSCPSSTTLRVLSAFWGRTTAKICRYNAVTDCRLDVTSKIKARCEGKNGCLLEASVSLGPDPCFGVRKYLNISYVCEDGKVDSASCPTGWQRTLDDTRCFGLFFDRKNWQDSRRACQNLGGDVASFHSSTDNIVATSLLINSWDIGDIDGIWIGLTDAGQKGIYRWTDGTDVDYSSWLHGQPDERNPSGSCVSATLQRGQMSSLFWKDVNCTLELPYACSMYSSHGQASSPPPTTVPMVPCPFGWMYMSNGSFCYKLMAQSKTWTAARDACRAFGQNSDLVSIQSLAENNFVADIVVNGSAAAFAVWIGLSDRGVLYGHTWSDKSPLKFTRWTPQQPDSHHGQQPCVEMYSTGEWGDTGCYSIKTFICKMPRPRKVVTSAPPLDTAMQAPGICPPEWILWNTMCYYFSNGSLSGKKTWQEALRECQKIRGGDLVSIHSAAENSFIKSRTKMKTSLNSWIGLNDRGTEASFKWSDGSPVQYINYNPKEPNDFYHQEDCIEMLTLRGTWNDNHCSRSRPFICKKTNNTVVAAPNTIAPSTGPKLKSCKEGWINYGTSCYLFVSYNRQTWLNAQSICKQGLNDGTKGDLVTVDDQYEQAFLTTMLVGEKSYFWIGLNALLQGDETFFWAGGSPVKYTNWGAKQPRTAGLNRPYCVMMNMFGRWTNKNCHQTSGFVCETGALADDTNTTAAPSGNRTCPLHYEILDDDCLFVSYVKLSWQEAREACQRESNGNLMSVHSVFEQAFVVRALKNFNGGLWLGFVREANSAEFSWSDQSLSLYTAWASHEPNSPSSQKSCVVANNSNSNAGLWSDVACAERNGFVCRISKGEPHISPAVLGSCPIGWEKFDKHCYLFRAEDRMSWASARYSCERRGGNLLSITSQQEQDYILYHYTSKQRGNVWIGLNDRALEAGYTWSDGSPVTFLNWNPGEPNDKIGGENCVEMYSNSRWNDKACNVLNGYICRQPLECSAALGMVNGSITDGQVNASSRVSDLYSAKMARLNSSSAWCAGNDHPNQFIQVDLLTETRISKIATQGFILHGVDSYISAFKLQACEDGINFYTYQKYGKDWVFIANRDANSIVTFAITPTVNARLIRLVPITWKGSICLRMELYGCPFACETPLGMQSGALNDSDISASSSGSSDTATNARPSNDVGWCARASDTQPWLQISFPNRETKITKITTWGGGRSSGYVKVYRLQFTDATGVNTWLDYREGGKIRNFRGNQDAVSPLTHRLAEPIITNNLRVKPLYWSVGGVCLRLEVFGCGSALLTTSSAPSAIPTSVSSVRPKEVLYSGSFKLSKEEWTENYNNPKSTEFNTLAAKLEKSIRQLYSGVDEASFAFRNVTVTGFRRGSVTVMFNLTFTRDMANELGANVTNNFVNAVRSGSMGEFAVDPKSLSIVKYESSGTTIGNPTTSTQTEGELLLKLNQ